MTLTPRRLLSLALMTVASPALAVDVKFDAFADLVVGKILQGNAEDSVSGGATPCPCFIADYGNGLIYNKTHPLITTESRAGLQGKLSITDDLSLVAQVVGRTGTGKLSLEWAYLSYDLGTNWTFQAGRKRIPIFYYSEFQDIGYAYIWVRPPGELYGWDMNNYNGASVRYRTNVGDLAINSSVFGGSAYQDPDLYFHVYLADKAAARWNDMGGADLELNYDWLTTRFVYIQSHNQYNEENAGWGDYNFNVGQESHQHIYGMAVNLDFGNFFSLNEMNLIVHDHGMVQYRSPSYSVGAGYRIGKWTPFINYSDYTDSTTTPDVYPPGRFDNTSLTLRYDFAPGNDVKLQYQYERDMSYPIFFGNARLVSASYDVSI